LPMNAFDLRETLIPFSLLQLTNHFNQMKPGEAVEIIGSDISLITDLTSILPESAYEIVLRTNQSGSGRDFRLQIKKTKPIKPEGGKSCLNSI